MIRNKKFLTLVLALVMVLGAFSTVFAAAAVPTTDDNTVTVAKVTGRDNKIQYLIDNKYVEGRKVNEDPADNDLALDKNIKRSEITKLLVYAIGRQDLAAKLQGAVKIYSDVDTTYWANGVITVGTTMASPANAVAMLNGYPDGSFKPERDVTYAELAKMLVVLVKDNLTAEMANNAVWPSSWLAWAAELGILEDVTVADANRPANRADAFVMLYNAFYKLRYVEKVPANETMGIMSGLTRNKLTLNQGSYAKTFNLTDDTNFVLYQQYDGSDDYVSRIVRVASINNPTYYYGSLVRVLTDANGNVTHILELGNPAQLALGVPQNGYIGANSRWAGVAKNTAETAYGFGENLDGGATITYRNATAQELIIDNTGARVPAAAQKRVTLDLTSGTRYFVADPSKNQLTEVANVDAALAIVGYDVVNNNRVIKHVYAGFDGDTVLADYLNANNATVYAPAKVVVFNKVAKANTAGTLYRVKNEATTAYNATLETVDGTEVVASVADAAWAFPYNFNDAKLNVIKLRSTAVAGERFQLMIDHSETAKYPIVTVQSVDGNKLVLRDVYGDTAGVVLENGYDKFLNRDALQNAVIQFRTTTDNDGDSNVIEIVSVLTPFNIAPKGSLNDVVGYNQGNQRVGDVIRIGAPSDDAFARVTIDNQRNLYDEDERFAREVFRVDLAEARVLAAHLGVNVDDDGVATNLRLDRVRYKVQDDVNNTKLAYDFEIPVTNRDGVVTYVHVEDYNGLSDDVAAKLTAYATNPTKENYDYVVAAISAHPVAEAQTYYAEQLAKVRAANLAIDAYNANPTAENRTAAQTAINAVAEGTNRNILQAKLDGTTPTLAEANAAIVNYAANRATQANYDAANNLVQALSDADKATATPDLAEVRLAQVAFNDYLDNATPANLNALETAINNVTLEAAKTALQNRLATANDEAVRAIIVEYAEVPVQATFDEASYLINAIDNVTQRTALRQELINVNEASHLIDAYAGDPTLANKAAAQTVVDQITNAAAKAALQARIDAV